MPGPDCRIAAGTVSYQGPSFAEVLFSPAQCRPQSCSTVRVIAFITIPQCMHLRTACGHCGGQSVSISLAIAAVWSGAAAVSSCCGPRLPAHLSLVTVFCRRFASHVQGQGCGAPETPLPPSAHLASSPFAWTGHQPAQDELRADAPNASDAAALEAHTV